MTTTFLSYRDAATCAGTDMQPGYVRENVTDTSRMMKEQVFPGMYGFPDMHVTHVQEQRGEQAVFVIALTEAALDEAALDEAARVAVLEGAWAFLEADAPTTSTPVGKTLTGRSVYPPPRLNPLCHCPNPMASMLCMTGHMTECHWPQNCREANCAHMDGYEQEAE